MKKKKHGMNRRPKGYDDFSLLVVMEDVECVCS